MKMANAQLVEDFSDGDISINPTWTSSDESGNGTDFIVIAEELQSSGPSATSTIFVSTEAVPSTSGNLIVWEFYVRYEQSPSSSNNIEIFVLSNEPDLSTNPEGYFIRLGESGSDDGIDFYKTSSTTALIEDSNPSVATGVNVRIRLSRDDQGNWLLESDPTGGTTYLTIGSVSDTEFIDGPHFGFKVEHTSTRRESFFFDDIEITATNTDVTPPDITMVEVMEPNQLTVFYNESVESLSATELTNYSLNNDFGNPTSAELVSINEILLTFSTDLISSDYELTVDNVTDISGNAISSQVVEFSYFIPDIPEFRDVIITEVMADPEPSVGLPDTDYIEIFNNSNKIFDLANWTIADGNSSAILSTYILPPGEYLILTSVGSATGFVSFGNVLGVTSFPNFNNSGDDVLLSDNTDLLLDRVIYDDSWYRSSIKDEGGYSLEAIDLTDFCSTADNWIASESSNGGTPGQQNSVFSSMPDNIGPELLNAFGTAPDTITLIFNELLDENSIQSAQYQLSNDLIIENISSTDLTTVFLKLSSSSLLQTGSVYEINVTNVSDCPGNIIGNQNTKRFSLIESGEPGDLIINEILFNPKVGGDDFLEIYNNSDRFISLKNWKLANGEILNDSLITGTIRTITDEMSIVGPQEYRAITTDNINLQDFYPSGQSDNYIEAVLPSFSDDNGVVVLMNSGEEIMDLFAYTEDYHSTILNDNEGVSLERISFEESTQNADNWISAASNVGFATPGYQNSQIKMINTPGTGSITIDPKVVIPDGDGQNDFTTIGYSFDQQGYVATVTVYDIAGRVVKSLASNDFLPSSGFYTWDGTDDEGRIAKMGYYIVYFEAFDSAGNTLSFKEKVVIGTRF